MSAIRPIIFSGAMVRALLGGTKTQTRRLASSPLADSRPGDRLWVRESILRATADRRLLGYVADGPLVVPPGSRVVPSIHMPREACRLTLEITAVRREPLQAISEADAAAEGMIRHADGRWWTEALAEPSRDGAPRCWIAIGGTPTARDCYRNLWHRLHGPEAWDANPAVVVLSFTVRR